MKLETPTATATLLVKVSRRLKAGLCFEATEPGMMEVLALSEISAGLAPSERHQMRIYRIQRTTIPTDKRGVALRLEGGFGGCNGRGRRESLSPNVVRFLVTISADNVGR